MFESHKLPQLKKETNMPTKPAPELLVVQNPATFKLLQDLWKNLNELSCIVEHLHNDFQIQTIHQTHSQSLGLLAQFNSECEKAIDTYYQIFKNDILNHLTQQLPKEERKRGDEGVELELQEKIKELKEQYQPQKDKAIRHHLFEIEDIKRRIDNANKH